MIKFSILFLIVISACSAPERTTTERIVPPPERTTTERIVPQPDLTTYKNLTDLKPEVVMLYETFMQDPPDHEWIWSVRLRLAQAYEYEKGKEKGETAGLISNIRKALENDLEQRGKAGVWTEAQLSTKIKSIESSFDAAIKRAWSEKEE